MRRRVSMGMPKALSRRRAMSPERAALLLSRLESAGRETLRAAAAAVTVRPVGSIISVRMKSPGWGGFFRGIGILTPFALCEDLFRRPLGPRGIAVIESSRPDLCGQLKLRGVYVALESQNIVIVSNPKARC